VNGSAAGGEDCPRPQLFATRRDWLLERVHAGEVVLDVGCGDGAFAAELAAAGCDVVGVDVDADAIERAARRAPGARFALWSPDARLPLADASVDVVWAGEVIEHVAELAAWLSELRRVLRSGGRMLLSTPYHGRTKNTAIALIAFERHFDPLGEHVRFFTRRSLAALLTEFGFEQISLRTIGGVALLRETLLAEATRARPAFVR
jgi:2-polyprenyl-3-methyl-5-hydroxy-6-metoxy-1,4-benzoquinol methylase